MCFFNKTSYIIDDNLVKHVILGFNGGISNQDEMIVLNFNDFYIDDFN